MKKSIVGLFLLLTIILLGSCRSSRTAHQAQGLQPMAGLNSHSAISQKSVVLFPNQEPAASVIVNTTSSDLVTEPGSRVTSRCSKIKLAQRRIQLTIPGINSPTTFSTIKQNITAVKGGLQTHERNLWTSYLIILIIGAAIALILYGLTGTYFTFDPKVPLVFFACWAVFTGVILLAYAGAGCCIGG